jgi:hypothetical protein
MARELKIASVVSSVLLKQLKSFNTLKIIHWGLQDQLIKQRRKRLACNLFQVGCYLCLDILLTLNHGYLLEVY